MPNTGTPEIVFGVVRIKRGRINGVVQSPVSDLTRLVHIQHLAHEPHPLGDRHLLDREHGDAALQRRMSGLGEIGQRLIHEIVAKKRMLLERIEMLQSARVSLDSGADGTKRRLDCGELG